MKLIKLYADWCGPCKVLEKMLSDNEVEHESISIDSPEGEDLTVKYNVRALPTLLVFDDKGDMIRKKSGLPADFEEIKKFLYEAD